MSNTTTTTVRVASSGLHTTNTRAYASSFAPSHHPFVCVCARRRLDTSSFFFSLFLLLLFFSSLSLSSLLHPTPSPARFAQRIPRMEWLFLYPISVIILLLSAPSKYISLIFFFFLLFQRWPRHMPLVLSPQRRPPSPLQSLAPLPPPPVSQPNSIWSIGQAVDWWRCLVWCSQVSLLD